VLTDLGDTIFSSSNKTPVLAPRVAMQMRREFGLNCLSRLDGDNDIAGQVGNSCHYSEAIAVSKGSRSRLGVGRAGKGEGMQQDKTKVWGRFRQTYQPLQACESLVMLQWPCCQCGDCPSGSGWRRRGGRRRKKRARGGEGEVTELSGRRGRRPLTFFWIISPCHP
jgi:hypothetical protein